MNRPTSFESHTVAIGKLTVSCATLSSGYRYASCDTALQSTELLERVKDARDYYANLEAMRTAERPLRNVLRKAKQVMTGTNTEKAYALAKEQYAELDVDTETALASLERYAIALHCWQADDVGGFERPGAELGGGGIQVTGNYPGKARNVDEARQDYEKVLSLLPGKHRLNLHASYGEFASFVERDAIGIEQFQGWIDWAKAQDLKLDFNSTCFSHPKAETGYTLSSKDKGIRDFWIEHVKRCREISAAMGRQLGSTCIHNGTHRDFA